MQRKHRLYLVISVALLASIVLFGCAEREAAGPFDGITLKQAVAKLKNYAKDYPDAQLFGASAEELKQDGTANWREIALVSTQGKALIKFGYQPAKLPPQAAMPAPRIIERFPQESGSDMVVFVEDLSNQTPVEPLGKWLDPTEINAKNQWFWNKVAELAKPPYDAKVSLSLSEQDGRTVWVYEVDWGKPVEKISPTEYKMLAKTSRFYFNITNGKNIGPRSWD